MHTQLAGLSTIDAVRGLFEKLGYRGTFSSLADATVVAQWKGYQVAVVESGTAAEAVRSLARSLSALAGRALAVALDPGRQLAVAAPRLGSPGITPVLLVDLTDPVPDAVQMLERCRPTEATGLAHAVQIDRVLSSELAGERFYAAFRILHGQLIERSRLVSPAERHLAGLLPLLRVLFLYFVQAKGWLDGRNTFLREQLDSALRRRTHFHRTVLNPLFFETLSRPVDARSPHDFGRIPYLNGGLFEPHPVERGPSPPVFSNRWWRDAFDDVFERFRFCVRESEQVGAIAPDMLGRVFERLMTTDERHASGTFYTPEVIVRQVVDATLETALIGPGRLSEPAATHLVRHRRVEAEWAPVARRALRRLRILDPAVGSGAFLLGALDTLTHLHASLTGHPIDARQRLALRKQILRDNLFGVDRNPVAVRLAELRLWLAVIADDPTRDIEHVEPLPNLDGVIRQGDSLLDPLAAAYALGTHPATVPADRVSAVARARRAVFQARGDTYRSAIGALSRAEAGLSRSLLRRAVRDLSARVADLDAVAESRTLFGERTGLTPEQRAARKAMVQQRDALELENTNAHRGLTRFFSFTSHLPEVMREGGFCAVIGNPPWVRSERLAPALRKTLKWRFRWWLPEQRSGFTPLPDLSVAFLERALELTRPGGAVGLLLPSKITTAGYAARARAAMVRETHVRFVHRIPERQADLFGATTYPAALVLRKSRPAADAQVHLGFPPSGQLAQRQLDRPGPWMLIPDRARQAVDELLCSAPPLGALGVIRVGVKTGANGVFLGRSRPLPGRRVRVTTGLGQVDVPESYVRLAVRGRDVRPFAVEVARVVLWPFDSGQRPLPLQALPRDVADYFLGHRAALTVRSDYRTGAFWLPFRTGGATGGHRVIWPDISRGPKAVSLDHADRTHCVPLNTCYVFSARTAEEALVTAAVFNTVWVAALVRVTADEARGGYRRINARVASTVPVPDPGETTSAVAAMSRDIHEQQRVSFQDLDDAVADALGLSPRTRATLRALSRDNG